MKKLLVLVAFLALALSPGFAGTAIKKSGSIQQQNYVNYNSWDFDTAGTATTTGAAAGTNTDTVILYQDSASSTFYTTSSLRIQTPSPSIQDYIADSLKYCVLAADDAADAVTLRTEYQVKMGNNFDWMTIGGNGDMTLAGAGVKVFNCFSRTMIPGVKHRIVIHPSTTTDVAKVFKAFIVAIRK